MILLVAGVGLGVWAFRTGKAAAYVREQVVVRLQAQCGVEIDFSDLRILPFRRQVQLSDLQLEQGGAPWMSVEEALFSIQLFPLFYGRVQLDRVALLRPQVAWVIRDGKVDNLPACLAPDDAAKPEPGALPVALGVSEFTVERGVFRLKVDGWEVDLEEVGLALFPGPLGGTDLALGLDGARITRGTDTLVFQRLRLLGHLEGLLTRPRALGIEQLEVHTDVGQMEAEGSVDLLGPVAELAVDADADLSKLRPWIPGLPPSRGKVRLSVQVTASPAEPRVAGSFGVRGLKVGPYGMFDQVRGRFVADRSGLQARDVRVRLGDGGASASARIRFEPGLPIAAQADADQLSLGHLLHALNVPHPWADLEASGPASVAGTLQPLDVEGPFRFRARNVFVADRSFWQARTLDPAERMLDLPVPATVVGRWRFTPEDLRFVDSRVEGGATRARVSARIGLKPERGHDIQATFAPLDFEDLGPIAGVPFTGRGDLQADLHIGLGDLRADGRMDLEGASAAGLPLGRVFGPVQWRDVTWLRFPRVRGRLGRTDYGGSMSLRLVPGVPSELAVEVDGGRLQDLRRLLPGVPGTYGRPQGSASGTARLSGPLAALSGDVKLEAPEFELWGQRYTRGTADVDVEQGNLQVHHVRAMKGGAWWKGRGRYEPLAQKLSAELHTEGFPVAAFDGVTLQGLKGLADFDISVNGPLDALDGRHRIRVQQLGIKGARLGSGGVRGAIRRGTVEVTGEVGGLQLDGSFQMDSGLPFQLKSRWQRVPVLDLMAAFQGGDFGGSATGELELGGRVNRPSSWKGRLGLQALSVRVGQQTWQIPRPVRLDVDKSGLETSKDEVFTLENADSRVSAAGFARVDSVELRLDGGLDLTLLERWTSSAERADGLLSVEATLTGPPERLDLVGTARIRDGVLQWARVDDPLVDFDARLSFSQKAILVDQGSGRWAGGRVALRGNVVLSDFVPGRVDMFVDIEGARPRIILPAADAVGQLDGQVMVGGTADNLQVRGELDVRRGLIEPRIDLRSMIESSPPVAYDPTQEMVTFDVALRSVGPVRLQSDGISAQVTGDVRWTGTNQRPGLLGSASVEPGGRVSFLGREYRFVAGAVQFDDRYRFSPDYDLSLRAEACSARIQVGIDGTLEEFDLVYSSSPEMGQEDIVSCLIRGIRSQTLADERNIGAFAGSTLLKLSGVDQEVKKVIPVDQIDVTTEFSSVSRSYEPRLLVAKDLNILNKSLRLEYSSSFLQSSEIETTDQRAALRLRLSPRLDLQLGWTSALNVPLGDWGLDLKHRWEWR